MKTIEELGIEGLPWRIVNTVPEYTDVVTPGGKEIYMSFHEDEAPTARLIAAAPDLYEALREIEEAICATCAREHACTGVCDAVAKAKTALAKAAGRRTRNENA